MFTLNYTLGACNSGFGAASLRDASIIIGSATHHLVDILSPPAFLAGGECRQTNILTEVNSCDDMVAGVFTIAAFDLKANSCSSKVLFETLIKTRNATVAPTVVPSARITLKPSMKPFRKPSSAPTNKPFTPQSNFSTNAPTRSPTWKHQSHSQRPTFTTAINRTNIPTVKHTAGHSRNPSMHQTVKPSRSLIVTKIPTKRPKRSFAPNQFDRSDSPSSFSPQTLSPSERTSRKTDAPYYDGGVDCGNLKAKSNKSNKLMSEGDLGIPAKSQRSAKLRRVSKNDKIKSKKRKSLNKSVVSKYSSSAPSIKSKSQKCLSKSHKSTVYESKESIGSKSAKLIKISSDSHKPQKFIKSESKIPKATAIPSTKSPNRSFAVLNTSTPVTRPHSAQAMSQSPTSLHPLKIIKGSNQVSGTSSSKQLKKQK